MAGLITETELLAKYKNAASIPQAERAGYINRASAYARGILGGEPREVTDDIKEAVALLVQGELEPVDAYANNSYYDRKKTPQGRAEVILAQYAEGGIAGTGASGPTDRSVKFL